MVSTPVKMNRFILAAIVFFSVVAAIYANTWRYPFIYDDNVDILLNPDIRLKEFSLEGFRKAAFESNCRNRPVSNISFALNYFLHEYRLPGYHLVNILIHFLNGLAVFFLFYLTLPLAVHANRSALSENQRTAGRKKIPLGPPLSKGVGHDFHISGMNVAEIAFWAALIWMVNPLHTNSVTYIVQRMTSLVTLFYAAAMLCFIKGRLALANPRDLTKNKTRAWLWFGGAAMAGILALGSKEIAATLPIVILLYEWVFFREGRLGWLKRRWPAVVALIAIPAAAGTLYLMFHKQTYAGIFALYPQLDFTPAQRLLTESRVVIYYLNLLLFPFPRRMSLLYDYPLSQDFFNPLTTPLAVLAVIALVFLAFHSVRKNRLLAFAILWYFGNLVIESSVLPLDIVFEHRTYLPSIFPVLAAVYFLGRLPGNIVFQRVFFAAMVVALACGAYIRNRDWRDPIVLWGKMVAHSPGRYHPHNDLGAFYLQQGRLEEALKEFEAAVRLKPDYAEALDNMGITLFQMNRTDEAHKKFEQALVHDPKSAAAHFNLGCLLYRKDRIDEALAHYDMATRLDPGYVKAWGYLGLAWMRKGRMQKAETCFRQVQRLRPADKEAGAALEQIAEQRESLRAEATRIQSTLEADPKNPALLFQLGMAHEKSEEWEKALHVYGRMIASTHDARPAAVRSAAILAEAGRMDAAMGILQAMILRFPDDAGLHYNLACLHARKGDGDGALRWLKKAVERGYDNWELIRTDRDLDPIRNDPGFVEFLAGR